MDPAEVVTRGKLLNCPPRHRFAFNFFWVGCRENGPDPGLKTLHGQYILVEQPMADAKPAAPPVGDFRLNDHHLRQARGRRMY